MIKNIAAIDAETRPIGQRPDYPPESVGYAVKHGRTCRYFAYGHPTGNNCTKSEALTYIRKVVKDHVPVFHNAEFDLEVLRKDRISVKGEYHDTLKLAFLNEPRSVDLGLKPQAEMWLGDPPTERDMLKEWILENIPGVRRAPSRWGSYICEAPGKLVGEYAKGDVKRTWDLFKFFEKEVINGGMDEAYEREMALVPIVLGMENSGIRVRLKKLKRELPGYVRVRDRIAKAIHKRLGVGEFNIGSSKQLAHALIENDLMSVITKTANGNVSTKRVLLEQYCTDKKLVAMLTMHATLETYLGTFLGPWVELGEANDEYIQPSFNTTRSSDEYGGGKGKGARTGRFSSSEPNLQNVPSSVEESPHFLTLSALAKELAKEKIEFVGLRDYFTPDEGFTFIRRDYSQQELRILAHFEEGEFLKMYMDDPSMDAHDAVKALVAANTGLDFPRKHIKQTNFGIIYGMGVAKLASRLDITVEEAKRLKNAVMKAVPGIKSLNSHLKGLARRDEPFYTWGGREYYCEEPILIDLPDGGKKRLTFEYKMMNTIIQGSAADCTKQGMINVYQNKGRDSRIVLQVHDELVMCVPKGEVKKENQRMMEAMEDVDFRVPMLSDGEVGAVSWARMKKIVDRRRAA